jgi:RNA polymerase sigma-70 factor (ECF subfamily)
MPIAMAWKTCSGLRLVPTTANGQPAFAVYAIHVLAFEDDMISTMTLFVPPTGPRLFHAFGLPLSLPDAASAELPSRPQRS